MSQHPKVEAKIVEELLSHDLLATPEKPQPRPIQWEDVPKLTYLTAVIKVAFLQLIPRGNIHLEWLHTLSFYYCEHTKKIQLLKVTDGSLFGRHCTLIAL